MKDPTTNDQDRVLEHVLMALPSIVVVVDAELRLTYMNSAAEQLLQGSFKGLKGQRLDRMIPADNPLFTLICQARSDAHTVAEYRVPLTSPRIGSHIVNVQAAPLPEVEGSVVVSMQVRSLTAKIDRQLIHRGAARSLSAMAAMLAHEVKNPMSGIRGAAQLLADTAGPDDRMLTRLICDEADRICRLFDRMELFTADARPERDSVNIHEVLNRVRTLAENSFARHAKFVERYDPSLPPVFGNLDQLVQVFLNIVKNAAEALPREGGEIAIITAYSHGVRFALSERNTRVSLPLMVEVQDNGTGIPEDLKPHLFEPFITSKPQGSGLGLALVAKFVGDHGGVIECDSEPSRTTFRILLPIHAAADPSP
jgi:two-component system nitrogen regulation sensor histidine kinase GlnL